MLGSGEIWALVECSWRGLLLDRVPASSGPQLNFVGLLKHVATGLAPSRMCLLLPLNQDCHARQLYIHCHGRGAERLSAPSGWVSSSMS